MRVRRANKNDLPGINTLSLKYGWGELPPEFLNRRDIAIVALDDDNIVRGFIWAGLMAQNKCGYIDWFMVDPNLASKGVGHMLCHRLVVVANKLKVNYLLANVQHNQYHDQSAVNALKIGLKPFQTQCTTFLGLTKNMMELLGE